MSPRPLRIQFVLNSLMLTGGVRVVYEHSRRLRSRGHQVRLLALRRRRPPLGAGAIPWKRYLVERWWGGVEDGLRSYGLADAVTWFDPVPGGSVPPADVVLATAWGTAQWVLDMPDSAGRKFYLVQGYEAWTEDIRAAVDETWRMPLRKIVIARWLERLAVERFGGTVWCRIPNGVDTERFRPGPARQGPPFTLAMIYDRNPHKAVEDGLAALWSIHRAEPRTRFVLFGRGRLRHRLPPGSRYVLDPRQSDLPRLYQDADLFVHSSHSEGFSLVTLEAMACGCALVCTAVGEAAEMGRPGEEYVLVPPGRPEELARAVIELLRDPPRLRAIGARGLALARRYNWEHATDLLEQALVRGEP
jgi:glycosyltransferase involved in cell wall biosynthesis